MAFVTEPGLYKVIQSGRRPEAPDLDRWLRHAIRMLDADEKEVHILHTPDGPKRTFVISEARLYKLARHSRRPEAREFDRWVRHTVLPALHKDEMYVVGG